MNILFSVFEIQLTSSVKTVGQLMRQYHPNCTIVHRPDIEREKGNSSFVSCSNTSTSDQNNSRPISRRQNYLITLADRNRRRQP